MIQLILHLWGDYIFQSDWAANNKTSNSFACLVHVTLYSLPFLLLRPSVAAFAVIFITHFFIDRFRLAKYLVYAKNLVFAPPNSWCDYTVLSNGTQVMKGVSTKFQWENCKGTGYPSETPPFMAVWLMIICDNTLHLTINYLALRFL